MEAAQATFEAFLAGEPGSGPGLFRLSMVHARRGRHRFAVELAERALAIESDRVEVLTHLARCHLACGQPEKARGYATRALAMPRENPVVLDSLGVVMTLLDEQSLAMELFDQAMALEANQPSMYFNRALAQKQFGLLDGAERDLETCLVLNPVHAKAHWTLSSLRKHDLATNHVQRLRQQLAWAQPWPPETELLALALSKELDDLGDSAAAAEPLLQGIAARRGRVAPSADAEAVLVDRLIQSCDDRFVRSHPPAKSAPGPVFVFGMPRSGVALLGSLLSRHSRIQHLGGPPAFSRQLAIHAGRESATVLDAGAVNRFLDLDHEALARRYLGEVCSPGKQLILCESHAMDFHLAGVIARALPNARLLHMTRDPLDNCLSILAHAGGDATLPSHDPAELAAYYRHYHRLMQHWHRVLPGRIMDVEYDSLVEKPEMILRVICAFLGIRYASSLRMGLKLHQRSIGRGARHANVLPTLADGLRALELQTRSS